MQAIYKWPMKLKRWKILSWNSFGWHSWLVVGCWSVRILFIYIILHLICIWWLYSLFLGVKSLCYFAFTRFDLSVELRLPSLIMLRSVYCVGHRHYALCMAKRGSEDVRSELRTSCDYIMYVDRAVVTANSFIMQYLEKLNGCWKSNMEEK